MLATAKWETDHTMQPIKERGGAAYMAGGTISIGGYNQGIVIDSSCSGVTVDAATLNVPPSVGGINCVVRHGRVNYESPN